MCLKRCEQILDMGHPCELVTCFLENRAKPFSDWKDTTCFSCFFRGRRRARKDCATGRAPTVLCAVQSGYFSCPFFCKDDALRESMKDCRT